MRPRALADRRQPGRLTRSSRGSFLLRVLFRKPCSGQKICAGSAAGRLARLGGLLGGLLGALAGALPGALVGALVASGPAAARAEPPPLPYLFVQPSVLSIDDLANRFPPPARAERVPLLPQGFGAWLRHLPLLLPASPVLLFDGTKKPNQRAHAAVVALDVPQRDLQQCADAVMRLRAEYLLALGRPQEIRFHPDPGKPRALAYTGSADQREEFMRYMLRVFSAAGSASLQAELARVTGPARPGDVLIQGGYPGHAVMVLDVAEAGSRRYLLLGQSYMPAQQFHVLRNNTDAALSPWYDEAELDTAPGLMTPEWWRPFVRKDLRRFPRVAGEPQP